MDSTDTSLSASTKASEEEEPKRMAIICWSNDLDRVWPVMILATTGAASGLEVDVFFTFWGLRVLQKNDKRVTGNNWMQKGESLFDRGGSEHLKLSKVHFAGMGTSMIKLLAKQHKVASVTELAIDVGVRLHPCQMTMDLYGLSTSDFIDGLQPTLGAASFIDMAAKADIQLFI
jgi:peroxiredoxin family protein